MMLNWLWYLPMMFVGIACWNKKMNDRDCVIKNRLTSRGRVITLLSCVAAIAIYALFLYFIGGAQPIMDSSTTVLSVAAMILTVRRCIEQWLMWIAVNAISVGMWLRLYMTQGNSAATLLWWMIMLITGIIFFVRWMQEMRAEKTEQIN
jgi:nicotinamide mononucleotide transporter